MVTCDARCVAFVRDGAVFSRRRAYLGRFENGFFRDRTGAAVAFVEGAKGEPWLPPHEDPPIPPIPVIAPIAPIAPIPPNARPSWSRLTWDSYILEV